MKCSNCNAEISDSAKFCPICGTKVEATNKCPNCGEPIKEGTKFCHVCGTKIAGDNEESPKETPIEPPAIPTKNTSEQLPSPPVSQAQQMTPPEEKTNSRMPKWKIVIIIVSAIIAFLLAVLIASIVIMSITDDSSDNSYDYVEDDYSSYSLSNTYNNEYISFKYPGNYKITDEERDEDGEISLNCEIKGDDLSLITFVCGENLTFYILDEQEKDEACMESLKEMNKTLSRSTMYDNVELSGISKKTFGNCTGYICNYTADAFSNSINGFSFMGFYGDYYVGVFTQAENDDYINQLDDILSTLIIKE